MERMTPRDVTVLIQELAERQDTTIHNQRQQIDSLRSIFGRLQAFVKDGWFKFEGHEGHWISTEAFMEILTAVEMIVDDDNTVEHSIRDRSNRLDDKSTGAVLVGLDFPGEPIVQALDFHLPR